jgi:hypothetical protein
MPLNLIFPAFFGLLAGLLTLPITLALIAWLSG